jgi:hypothetical protein
MNDKRGHTAMIIHRHGPPSHHNPSFCERQTGFHPAAPNKKQRPSSLPVRALDELLTMCELFPFVGFVVALSYTT